jgi:glycosyltransferase involved in cell wall biosynthesis
MPLLYRSADVFMHLSKDESFGNVFIEAMATGLPVVAPESKRTRWIVGDNEFLVDFDDPSEIAGKIGLALADTSGGESRVARAKAFSWTAIAQQYETFFNSILAT